MSETLPASDDLSEVTKVQYTPWMYGIVLLVFGVIIAGLLFIVRFNADDYARDVQNWREKLNLIAESRKADVNDFVSGNFTDLHSLADNPSLQLYLTELQMASRGAKAKVISESSQKSYLRNLLLFTAQRTGFMAKSGAYNIPANIPTGNKGGLIVVGNDDQLIVGTPMMTASMMRVLEYAKGRESAKDELIDLEKDADGNIYLGFSVPIYSIHGERNAEGQIGKIVAIKLIDKNLFGLLKQPGATEKTLETLLLRVDKQADQVEFVSPLQDGSALFRKINIGKSKSAEVQLVKGAAFSSELPDYRGQPVLATARDIAGTQWNMVVKVDKAEAFFESGANRASIVMSFTLIIALIVMIIITVWWYSYSRHALMASSYFKKVASKAQAQENLLRLVTDHQPEAIYIIDAKQTYWFANQKVAEAVNMSQNSIIGKTISDVRGAARGEQISYHLMDALEKWQPVYDVHRENIAGEEIIIRSGYIPLKEIPISISPSNTSGVLIVEQDVSEVYHERERRLSTQKQLVQTLLSLVDKRDPFSANHSLLVSQIAQQVAMDIGLDNATIDTTSTAASLMNIGKIVVPTELLTKTGQLTQEEIAIVRGSMDEAAELLEMIPFDGPVVETLKQWQERWDGTGPLGLADEDILISARVIAAANAFVGMISPRSWRDAMSIKDTNKFLLEQVGGSFDQRVVIAIIHYVENQSGREWLDNVLKGSKKVI